MRGPMTGSASESITQVPRPQCCGSQFRVRAGARVRMNALIALGCQNIWRLTEDRELLVRAHRLERMQRIVGLGRRLVRPLDFGGLRAAALRPSAAGAQVPRPRRLRWRGDEFRLRQNSLLRSLRRRGIEQERGGVGFRLGTEQEIGRIEIGFHRFRIRPVLRGAALRFGFDRAAASARRTASRRCGAAAGSRYRLAAAFRPGAGARRVACSAWGRAGSISDVESGREDDSRSLLGRREGTDFICSKLASRVDSCARVSPGIDAGEASASGLRLTELLSWPWLRIRPAKA